MNFKITYDKPGRIRFRAGAYAFEKMHEPRIHMACVKSNPIPNISCRLLILISRISSRS